jgi:hypothetical protein
MCQSFALALALSLTATSGAEAQQQQPVEMWRWTAWGSLRRVVQKLAKIPLVVLGQHAPLLGERRELRILLKHNRASKSRASSIVRWQELPVRLLAFWHPLLHHLVSLLALLRHIAAKFTPAMHACLAGILRTHADRLASDKPNHVYFPNSFSGRKLQLEKTALMSYTLAQPANKPLRFRNPREAIRYFYVNGICYVLIAYALGRFVEELLRWPFPQAEAVSSEPFWLFSNLDLAISSLLVSIFFFCLGRKLVSNVGKGCAKWIALFGFVSGITPGISYLIVMGPHDVGLLRGSPALEQLSQQDGTSVFNSSGRVASSAGIDSELMALTSESASRESAIILLRRSKEFDLRFSFFLVAAPCLCALASIVGYTLNSRLQKGGSSQLHSSASELF